jgi:flagellar biosynthesis GTPase FlhF
MKIIRHTARDMRQALRGVREQLGEDAVILSSRRTSEGVEITAAVDFDASTLEAGGFANTPVAPPPIIDATVVAAPSTSPSASRSSATGATARGAAASPPALRALASPPAPRAAAASPPPPRAVASLPAPAAPASAPAPRAITSAPAARTLTSDAASNTSFRGSAANAGVGPTASGASRSAAALNPTVLALTTRRAPASDKAAASTFRQVLEESAPTAYPPDAADHLSAADHVGASDHLSASDHLDAPDHLGASDQLTAAHAPALSYDELASLEGVPAFEPRIDDADWISDAAREAVAEHIAAPRAPVLAPASRAPVLAAAPLDFDLWDLTEPVLDPVEEIREATLTPLASNEIKATFAEFRAPAAPSPAANEAMGNELKTLRRMLETQLAHLAWNDLTRRAPVHTEILRELTEIGITHDLAEHLVRQLPEDTELTFARRFTIAGLSQYLKVTGDHWLDDGGRVAFAGATGVGKTTTLAKIAVRWVLRHGPRDIALVAADSVRIGAQDQLQSLAQLLGVPVYSPEKFENLPSLLTRLNERLILIDTPGSSVRDPQLANRLAVLANSASKLETALVLAASTQAGAIEEAVKHFAPANPSCCVLTKLDEAASIGGVLSTLIRARLPVSYMSEGQRVPEDLRPARALELVSAAVRLAKARGAAADEDLLRRRFGKTAHGIS